MPPRPATVGLGLVPANGGTADCGGWGAPQAEPSVRALGGMGRSHNVMRSGRDVCFGDRMRRGGEVSAVGLMFRDGATLMAWSPGAFRAGFRQ